MERPADGVGEAAEFVVVGVSHRTAEPNLCERLFLEEPETRQVLLRLKQRGLTQAMVLSTCDRAEVHAVVPASADLAPMAANEMALAAGLADREVTPHLYVLRGPAAVRHLFGVAASLDSLIVGEPQVLGQVKAGHRLAAEIGMMGRELQEILEAAYVAAKRVRSETAVAEQPVSIAAAAVQVARRVHGDLARASALLIGSGEMGDLIVEQLRQAGLGRLTLAHPSARRGETTARRYGCHFLSLDAVDEKLGEMDIVVSALGSGRPAVTALAVDRALKSRRRRPMLILDAALPGDVELGVDRLEEAFRYDLDSLERVALAGRASRQAAATAAHDIVDAELAAFLRGRVERGAVPTLVTLRRHFEAARQEALAAGGDADAVSQRLVNRLLHAPSEALRQVAVEGRDDPAALAAAEGLLSRLFALPEMSGAALDKDGDDDNDKKKRE
jgi:glutamyl-tRNA reductase